jgi:NTE family protein
MRPLALALSGGGLLGAAHLGALHFLESKKVRASAVAGTSAGGLVASLYALGVSMSTVIALGDKVSRNPADYFHLNVRGLFHEIWRSTGRPATGLLTTARFVDALLRLCPQAQVTTQWTLPTVLTSVDLVTLVPVVFTNAPEAAVKFGHWRVMRHQPLSLAMQATMALPGLFAAPRHQNQVLVDGGTADTLPIDWAQTLDPSAFVVAVDVATPTAISADAIGLVDVVSRAEAYATDALSRLRAGTTPHLTVRPDTANVPFFGFSDYTRLIRSGWTAMEKAWPAIERQLTSTNPPVPG